MLAISPKLKNIVMTLVGGILSVGAPGGVLAGGGMVIEDDICIVEVEFYSMHFTAFQPDTRGNEQFCQDLPDEGGTIFVLDYLHLSLKDVPVSFRIIREVTGQGRFVKPKHVLALGALEPHTVFYQEPAIEVDASFQADYTFTEEGEYIGIVTAGHPVNDNVYLAVFPLRVGRSGSPLLLPSSIVALVFGGALVWRRRRRAQYRGPEADNDGQGASA